LPGIISSLNFEGKIRFMRTLLSVIFIIICVSITAQPPGGRRGGGRPQGAPGVGRPQMMHNQGQQDDNFIITNLPEISGLTLKQREKLSKTISEERKDISKLIKEKKELERESNNPGLAGKERLKMLEKMEKIDRKVKEKEEKYDKKYRNILSGEQYTEFKKKKDEVRFQNQKNHNRQRPRSEGENNKDMPFGRPDGREPIGGAGEDMF